ncbi:MAG: addiction module protein [Acidobacteria bacterium]|nr:addiction module protein [Acidobacteriota bacterium]
MANSFEEIAATAMKLPARERVRLAQQLAASLEEEVEVGVETLWAAEAERRLEELRSGKVRGIDSTAAFRKAREAIMR